MIPQNKPHSTYSMSDLIERSFYPVEVNRDYLLHEVVLLCDMQIYTAQHATCLHIRGNSCSLGTMLSSSRTVMEPAKFERVLFGGILPGLKIAGQGQFDEMPFAHPGLVAVIFTENPDITVAVKKIRDTLQEYLKTYRALILQELTMASTLELRLNNPDTFKILDAEIRNPNSAVYSYFQGACYGYCEVDTHSLRKGAVDLRVLPLNTRVLVVEGHWWGIIQSGGVSGLQLVNEDTGVTYAITDENATSWHIIPENSPLDLIDYKVTQLMAEHGD